MAHMRPSTSCPTQRCTLRPSPSLSLLHQQDHRGQAKIIGYSNNGYDRQQPAAFELEPHLKNCGEVELKALLQEIDHVKNQDPLPLQADKNISAPCQEEDSSFLPPTSPRAPRVRRRNERCTFGPTKRYVWAPTQRAYTPPPPHNLGTGNNEWKNAPLSSLDITTHVPLNIGDQAHSTDATHKIRSEVMPLASSRLFPSLDCVMIAPPIPYLPSPLDKYIALIAQAPRLNPYRLTLQR
jgi:hypothetical protein